MSAHSLRGQLLLRLLPPVAVLLGIGVFAAYFVSLEPANEAYDHALVDVGIALGERIRSTGGKISVDVPGATERALRTDKYDTIYYQVRAPDGESLAGERDLPPPPAGSAPEDGVIVYSTEYRGQKIRAVALLLPCAGKICTVQVAETTNKRLQLARDIVLSSVVPLLAIALATLVIVWFGVKRGLAPLEGLSAEIRARSARDLRPIDLTHAPEEVKPFAGALNQLFARVDEASRNQQRFFANAAHQIRTPLAGLQAHTELALAQSSPPAVRAELEQVHQASVRTARLANQLLALARAEPGGRQPVEQSRVDLRALVEGAADEWVHRAMAKEIDLGFELEHAAVRGDEFLLREALGNLLHNALEYSARGGRVTARSGLRSGKPFLEVEDDGPGIPAAERDKVLERFYRISGTPGTGSGLGLAIVREIALAHGAAIEIGEGAGGRGCRIALRFPTA